MFDAAHIKERIGLKASFLVEDGMTVGLGTGTTATAFIYALAFRLSHEKLRIQTVASSKATEALALELKIPCYPIDSVKKIDITFDGADQIDPKKRLIKGRGGALLREKILAKASSELVIMAEEKKFVPKLGSTKLPVEVVFFGHTFTAKELKACGFLPHLRKNKDGTPYITDSGNVIYDISFKEALGNPAKVEAKMLSIPGVIETGLFLGYTGRIIIGKSNGTVVIKS